MYLKETSSKKTDLDLETILHSFGILGSYTLITDDRLQDPGLVIWCQENYRYLSSKGKNVVGQAHTGRS